MARILGEDDRLMDKAPALTVVSLLAISFIIIPQERPFRGLDTSISSVCQGIDTYSNGIFSSPPSFNLSSLMSLTGNRTGVADFADAITEFLVPLNVHMTLIDIGWGERANTSTTKIEYKEWLDNWLTACDLYGIKNIFFFKELGVPCEDGWTHDLLTEHRDGRTYDKWGNPVNHFSIDDPAVSEQLRGDLGQLYSYYGNHMSWVGISGGTGESSLYASADGKLREFGYSNLTTARFTSTEYFAMDINASGFHQDGTHCDLWRMFKDIEPSVVLSSGSMIDSLGVDVFDVYEMAVKIQAPSELEGFKVAWYGRKIGNPSDLVVELHKDDEGGFPSAFDEPMESVVVSNLSVGTGETWQPFVTFESRLSKGNHYTFVFRTEDGDSSNKYVIRYRHNVADGSIVSTGHERSWRVIGAAILWLQTADGSHVYVWPLQRPASSAFNYSMIEQTFVAPSPLQFNSVLFLLGERQYDEADATLRITRASDGQVLATGVLNQSVVHGLGMWVPILLNATVSAEAGQEYRIQVGGVPIGRQPYSFLRLRTDPDFAAFQGQGTHLIFRLALLRIHSKNFDFIQVEDAAGDKITGSNQIAVRFDLPSVTKLETLSFLVAHKEGQESLTVTLQADNETAESPTPTILWSSSIPASQVPEAGWATVTGINASVSAAGSCWIVFRTGPKTTYVLPRLSTPYKHLVMVSRDSGKTWAKPGEPMEIAFEVLGRSREKDISVGQRVETMNETSISGSTWIAQSFLLSREAQPKGLFFGPLRGATMGEVRVTLRTDSGRDTPTATIIAAGAFSTSNLTIFQKTLGYVEFDTIAHLSDGRKYWITIEPIEGKVEFYTVIYKDAEASYGGSVHTAKISADGGKNWSPIRGGDGDILFALVESAEPRPVLSTRDLVSDLEDHHAFSVSELPLHGWNSYVNIKQAELFENLVHWFETYTGRNWTFVGSTPLSVFKQIPLQHQILVGSGAVRSLLHEMFNVGTARFLPLPAEGRDIQSEKETRTAYLFDVPLLARPVVALNDWSPQTLAEGSISAYPLAFAEILSRMRCHPDYFGKERGAANVLALGGEDQSLTLHSLTSTLNITSASGRGEDLNLTRFGAFDQFDAILWLEGHPDPSEITNDARQRILVFVKNGGGLVVTQPWPEWASPAMGFRYLGGEVSQTQVTYANYSHPILRPLEDLQTYASRWRAQSFEQVSQNAKLIVNDSKGTPWISENSFGAGRTVFCSASDSQLTGDAMASTSKLYLLLLNNAIMYAAKKERVLPVQWYGGYQQDPEDRQLWHSVCGRPGAPTLVWLSNNGSETTFHMHLNATFYGLDPGGWMVLDIVSWRVVNRGVESDILINIKVPARSWKPLYLLNQTSDLACAYSNGFLSRSHVYPHQAVHVLRHHPNQTSWLAIQSETNVDQVQLNDRTIERYPSRSAINASESDEGWFRDPDSRLLLVKFQASGRDDVVRVVRSAEPVPWETSQQAIVLAIVLAVIGLELLVWARRRPKDRSPSEGNVKIDR